MPTVDRTAIALDDARLDDWFQKVAETSPSFEQLCSVLGEQHVAFSIISGVRIHSLTVDRHRPANTRVEFSLRDAEARHELSLPDLQRRLCAVLLEGEDRGDLPEPRPDARPQELQRFLGVKYVLLAGFFGIELLDLHVGGGMTPTVSVRAGTIEEEVRLDLFRDIIRARVRQELLAIETPRGFEVDPAVVREVAEARAAQDWPRIVSLVGTWPGPLAMLLRTEEGQTMDLARRAEFARVLTHLAEAHQHRGQFNSADDILRLAVQWSQDTPAASEVFLALGRFQLAAGQPGQAIGPLRRALSLGASEAEVMPTLAAGFTARGRHVAARACALRALRAGVPAGTVAGVLEATGAKLGPAWAALEALTAGGAPGDGASA